MIGRRHVLYVEGYDPQGAEGYYDLFARSWRRFLKIWPLRTQARRTPNRRRGLRALGDRGRWPELAGRNPLRIPASGTASSAPTWPSRCGGRCRARSAGRSIISSAGRCCGCCARRGGSAWCSIYFQQMLFWWLVLSACGRMARGIPAGTLCRLAAARDHPRSASRRRSPSSSPCGRWRTAGSSCRSTTTGRISPPTRAAKRPASTGRSRPARGALSPSRAPTTVDEIVVIGHSGGGAIAPAIVTRALELDPDVGRRGPPVVLMTLGSIAPGVALHPKSDKLRAVFARLAVEPSITWIDCQSRKDVMNFWDFDPVAGIGVQVGEERCNPLIWPLRFRDLLSLEFYYRIRVQLLPAALPVHHGERPARRLRLFHAGVRSAAGRGLGEGPARGARGVRRGCELRRRARDVVDNGVIRRHELCRHPERRGASKDDAERRRASAFVLVRAHPRESALDQIARDRACFSSSRDRPDRSARRRASRSLRPRARRPCADGGARRSSSGGCRSTVVSIVTSSPKRVGMMKRACALTSGWPPKS